MALVLDAVGANDFNCRKTFSKGRIRETVLEEVFLDLDDNEVISIIFLMTDIYTDISEVLHSLKNDCKVSFFDIPKKQNWGEKLLEALITIENVNVLINLGFNKKEIEAMKRQYFYDIHNVSENLNRVVKSLYFLCKEFTDSQVKILVSKVYEDLQEPVLHLTEEKMFLEIYILDWLQKKYISITDKPNLNKFIDILKINGLLISCLDGFESWKFSNRENQQDSSNTSRQSLQLEDDKNRVNLIDSNIFPWKDENHKRLCIIVNQVNFNDESRYPTRKGSDVDEKTIVDTFKGLNFTIEQRRDMTAPDMNEFLNSLSEKKYREYAAIFLFILSHGQDGEVIFSDGQPVKVEKIRKNVCCPNLENVFKFVILQSCQGKKIGFLNSKYTTDSPTVHLERNGTSNGDSNSIYQKHFGLYQATVNEFISVRHETKGSWFIQDACDELKKITPIRHIRLTEWVTNVNKRVIDRKAKTNNDDIFIVQIPCLKETTISEDYVFPKYNNNLICIND